ncbi:MAG: cysteine--tRNA ligase [Candidatus Marinimicrobia bacterium]|nr:cysteine--tRNA ligase [Candidatus Neomarinimicrobiota bacterium]MBL7010354.1 cysteine--tRNA ligase [Candidatus Neomarinimicrobiota bacterium]MBL7030018.1 cysteine--tRNA ligase [Candidatus Neomarinimicrobiota bacterium]
MLRFYNSLTRKKEDFIPIIKGKVSLYTCGPTVYDTAHIGNFRTFLFEDFLKRVLLARGFEVYHVMNITDVDDKTIQKSVAEGKPLSEITEYYTNLFKQDLSSLKIIPADVYPAATEHVDAMIQMIEQLIEKNHAYVTKDGSVFFSIDSYKNYGALTRLNMDKMQHSDRVSTDEYSLDNPQDFALWKAYKDEDGEVFWESPWGKGRPGWHMECSAMSMEYLGDHFDIHCGGVDNKFPHHENEIAQSVCAVNTPFVNYWLHSEFLLVDGGKMSKSIGNYYCVSDLLEKGMTSEEIRYNFLSAHYQTKVNFTLEKQHEAKRSIHRIMELQSRLNEIDSDLCNDFPLEVEQFNDALENNLDSPKALAVFFDWIRRINISMDEKTLSNKEASKGLKFISYFDSIYGILPKTDSVPQGVLDLSKEREGARQNKDWEKSDELRDQISGMGWMVKDTNDGPKLTPK